MLDHRVGTHRFIARYSGDHPHKGISPTHPNPKYCASNRGGEDTASAEGPYGRILQEITVRVRRRPQSIDIKPILLSCAAVAHQRLREFGREPARERIASLF